VAFAYAKFDACNAGYPEEGMPPSDMQALKKFVQAGNKLGIPSRLIGPKDIMRLPEYDGLFIRETPTSTTILPLRQKSRSRWPLVRHGRSSIHHALYQQSVAWGRLVSHADKGTVFQKHA